MRFPHTSKWLIGISSLLVLGAAFAFWPFRFYYDSVCSQCGAIQNATEWQLPHSQHSFFRRSTVETTELSRYLTSSGVVGTHQHQWLFGHGGGNGVRCALGDGDSIRATVTSPEVVRLLALTRQFGEQKENSEFLKFAFDRDISRTLRSLASGMPTNGFTNREEYRAWITNQKWLIDDALEMAKQNSKAMVNKMPQPTTAPPGS